MTDRALDRELGLALSALESDLEAGILGQRSFIRGLLVALIADGHVLIEGVPGLGKTRAVNLLAKGCQTTFQRLQFTPDLLPADILGTRIFNQQSSAFEVVKGPIFSNFILADEINRAPAKVQSALLETMQERQVTIGRESHPLQAPFLVFATQNPIEQEGTYPLPEAQLDRFLSKLIVDYPEKQTEPKIVRLVLDEHQASAVEPRLTGQQLVELQAAARRIFIEDRVILYATDLVQTTREPQARGLESARFVELGASPRASIALAQAGRAQALLEGRDAVTPDDIKRVAPDVLRHRVLTTYFADAEGVTSDQIINEILNTVEVP